MNLINLLITVLILAMIFGVIWWGIQKMGLQAPFAQVAIGVFVIIVVVVLVGVLTGTINFPILNIK